MQAYIGNIIPLSEGDLPNKACTVILFAGCDFCCPYCYSKDILDFKEEFLKDLKEVKNEIIKNADFIDAVIFSGGEPCLQRQALLTLARFTKENDLKVGIETNGSRPYSIKSLINENLLDFIALDIKAPLKKNIFQKVTKSGTFFKTTNDVINNIRQTLKLLKENENKIQIEIRTTIVPGLIFRKEDIFEIAKEINGLNCRWVLQQFIDEKQIVNPKLIKLESPKKSFLNDLKNLCQKKYNDLRIDIKTV
jgi:pyruvate formate lyase activating enzyme